MSVPVDTTELAARLETYGDVAHLVTVGEAGQPHIVSVIVAREDGDLVTDVGERTMANVAARDGVTLLWAAPPGEDYSLIVDGTARRTADARVAVTPTSAVLHRLAGADPSQPSCIRLLRT